MFFFVSGGFFLCVVVFFFFPERWKTKEKLIYILYPFF